MQLPLKRTEDVYHASVGIYHEPKTKLTRIYKRFEDYYLQFHPKLEKRKYNIGSGHFRNHMLNYPILITKRVTFYGCGDINTIDKLLGHLTHLGKKSAIGAGRIRSYKIKEAGADYSFYKENHGVMRPIPTSLNVPLPKEEGQVWMRMTYKPPYWDQRHATLCWAPKNQIGEALE
jgi:CRISPR type IV-associated protein Csf3